MPTSEPGASLDVPEGGDVVSLTISQNDLKALEYVWAEYRKWAAHSRKLKNKLLYWRFTVLALTVASAILGLSAALAGVGQGDDLHWMPKALGLAGAVSIGLAGYFGREILSPDRERHWVQCRSMAEACKSEAYRYATHAPPYNVDRRADLLIDKVDGLKQTTAEVWADPIEGDERLSGLPPYPMENDAYIEKRVVDQINWYAKSANENNRAVEFGRRVSWGLGALGVILGAITGFFEWAWPAALIAVVGTITAALAAFLLAGRYQYLAISYRATGDQLDAKQTRWSIKPPQSRTQESFWDLVDQCENTISIENSAWMVEWSKKKAMSDDATSGTAPED